MNETFDCLLLKNQAGFPLYLCSKELLNRYAALLKDLDLTYTQYVVMMYFWEKETSIVKRMSETLLLDPSTLTPVLKRLEQKGYLRRERNAEDERNLTIALTEEGLQLQKKAMPIPVSMYHYVGLEDEEFSELHRLLKKMLKNMEESKEKEG